MMTGSRCSTSLSRRARPLNDLIGGQLQVMFDTMARSIGFIRAARCARSR